MSLPTEAPFYLDWTFWSFVAAAVAIVLSQLPPVRQLVQRPKILPELYARLVVSHLIGYPSVGAVIGIRNAGGQQARIERLECTIWRGGREVCVLEGSEFYPDHLTKNAQVFVPLTLPPHSEWTRGFNFFENLDRTENRQVGKLRDDLRRDLKQKFQRRREEDPEAKGWVVADDAALVPVMETYRRKFIWEPGEYELRISVRYDSHQSAASPQYRFTLYESDSGDLRKNAEDYYKYGFGPAIDPIEDQKPVIVSVSRA
jgi:ribosomal silencing factor RsfS